MTKIPIQSPEQIGRLVRNARKESGLTQREAAAFCNVGVRFLSDLENGKPTAHIGKTLQVLHRLGINLHVESDSAKEELDLVQTEIDFEKETNEKARTITGIETYKSRLEGYLSTHNKQKEKLKKLERNLLGLRNQIDTTSLIGTKVNTEFVKEQNKLLYELRQIEKVLVSKDLQENLDRLIAPFNRSIEELKTLATVKAPPSIEAFESSIRKIREHNIRTTSRSKDSNSK